MGGHTQPEFNIRLIIASVHRRAVQLAIHASLKASALRQALVTRIEAYDIIFEVTCIRADRFARRPRNTPNGSSQAQDRQ
jgi:hypothetical protein